MPCLMAIILSVARMLTNSILLVLFSERHGNVMSIVWEVWDHHTLLGAIEDKIVFFWTLKSKGAVFEYITRSFLLFIL